jgi:putative phosphoribosyl transferase
VTDMEVEIPAGEVRLLGDLDVPANPLGVVAFAHGTGSSRFSPRNRQVASTLQDARFSTLLMDLLTEAEETEDAATGHLRFDIDLLADRLTEAIDWLQRSERTRGLPIGLFGASTGAGAALVAAARRPDAVGALVSRGGRPDLAEAALDEVRAPILLIVGGRDETVIALNRQATKRLSAETELAIVPGATHLFEEPGALEEVARLAADWFTRHLRAANR